MAEKRSIEEINAYLECRNATYRAIQESDRSGYLDCFCNVCGQKFERKRNKLFQDCPICKNKKLVVGYNDMATTAKWMIPFLKDKEDAHRYMKSASNRTLFICPDCGYEKEAKINNVFNFGFSCPICGDGISRPNKFARSLFLQLPVSNLIFEYSSEWTNGKKYDVYFEYDNKKYVVEMDGEQHFRDSEWGKANSQSLNDGCKEWFAFANCIKMVRIPCEYGNYDGMIKALENSEIGDLIKQTNVDWKKCIINAETSYVKKICEYYESHKELSTEDIGNIFGFSRGTIRQYLIIGTRVGFCSYSIEKAKREKSAKAIENMRKSKRNKKEEKIIAVCKFANKHKMLTYRQISEHFGMTPGTISAYIRNGIEKGICSYSNTEVLLNALKESAKKSALKNGRKTSVYEGDILIGSYPTMTECVDDLRERFPEKDIKHDTIRKQLVKKPSYLYKGLLFVSA